MSVDTTVGRCIRRATLSLSQWRATRGSGTVEVGGVSRTVKLLASAAAELNLFVPDSHPCCAFSDRPDHENFALGGLGMALALCDLVGSGNHWLPPELLLLEEEGGVFPTPPLPVGGVGGIVGCPPCWWLDNTASGTALATREGDDDELDVSSIRSAAGAHPPRAGACLPPRRGSPLPMLPPQRGASAEVVRGALAYPSSGGEQHTHTRPWAPWPCARGYAVAGARRRGCGWSCSPLHHHASRPKWTLALHWRCAGCPSGFAGTSELALVLL